MRRSAPTAPSTCSASPLQSAIASIGLGEPPVDETSPWSSRWRGRSTAWPASAPWAHHFAAPALYQFRNRYGFTDAADAAFDRLWSAEALTWADLERSSRRRPRPPDRPIPVDVELVVVTLAFEATPATDAALRRLLAKYVVLACDEPGCRNTRVASATWVPSATS